MTIYYKDKYQALVHTNIVNFDCYIPEKSIVLFSSSQTELEDTSGLIFMPGVTIRCNDATIQCLHIILRRLKYDHTVFFPHELTECNNIDVNSLQVERVSMLKHLNIIDRGKKIRKLGEGTYGKVYMYTLGDKKYAVKISVRYGHDLSVSFLREPACMRRLLHRNIMNIIDIGFDHRNFYFVMPFAEKGSLYDVIYQKQKSIDLETKKYYAWQILQGVHFCISRGVMHRDIKPQNILVMKDNTIKITDFGIARAFGCVGLGATREVVTLYYRAPEILFGLPYDENSDKWSVGCVLYELFEMKRLFEETNNMNGTDEENILMVIVTTLGSPTNIELPGLKNSPKWSAKYGNIRENKSKITFSSPLSKFIFNSLIQYNPSKRSSLEYISQSSYFDTVRKPSQPVVVYNCLENLDLRAIPINQIRIISNVTLYSYVVTKEWLIHICEYMKLKYRIWFYTCILIHRCSPLIRDISKLQLYSLACLYISILYNTVDIIYIDELTELTGNKISALDLSSACIEILEYTDYDLLFAVPSDYMKMYSRFYSNSVRKVCHYILSLIALTELYSDIPVKYQGLVSLLASCIYNNELFRREITSELLQHYNTFILSLKHTKYTRPIDNILQSYKLSSSIAGFVSRLDLSLLRK